MPRHTVHAAERAWERYGIAPDPADWARAVIDITDAATGTGRAALLMARNDYVERWIVRLCGVPVVAVYSPERALILTVIPPGVRARQS